MTEKKEENNANQSYPQHDRMYKQQEVAYRSRDMESILQERSIDFFDW